MRSLEWTLIPQDWGPDKKRSSGHRHTQRDDPVGHGEEMAVCTPRREAPGGPAPPTAGSGSPACRTEDRECQLFGPPRLWDFVVVA